MNATTVKAILWITAILFATSGQLNAQTSPVISDSESECVDVDSMIQTLTQLASQPGPAKPSIESAIDALLRLREFPPALDVRRNFNVNLERRKFRDAILSLIHI